jgi:isopropylmalate/homocitrate/citramalate synthase
MRHKLKMDREQVLERVVEMVSLRAQPVKTSNFRPKTQAGAIQSSFTVVLSEAIKAGATTLNVPDTVGYTTPDEFGALVAGIIKNTPGIENCIVSVHCHDDLGLATANTLAGIQAGARQVECTVNGIGERAGNTSLEEVVMALNTRPSLNLITGIDTTQTGKQTGEQLYGHRRPAQQGHCRRQCVCARSGHSSRWDAQAPANVRDHATRSRGRHADAAGVGQALGSARAQGAAE